jgi:hypothetical protein
MGGAGRRNRGRRVKRREGSQRGHSAAAKMMVQTLWMKTVTGSLARSAECGCWYMYRRQAG